MKNLVTLLYVLFAITAFSQNPNWVLFDHTNAPFTNDNVTCVKVDTNNVKWVGTSNGLFKFLNNTWTEYNMSNSNIPTNDISRFEIAYDNTIWFTNNGSGFYKCQNNVFTLYDQTNLPSLSTQNFSGLTVDSNDVFLWSDNEGIVKFNAVSSSVTNINSSNSCLQNIGKLVAHDNHMIYGLVKTPVSGSGPPQNLADSITYLNDFTISNVPGMPVSCCFNNIYSRCTYIDVLTDRYGNRYEVAQLYTGTPSTNQRLRTYNKNNVLLSDINYNQQPEYQFATNTQGYYRLAMTSTTAYALNVTLYNPASTGMYGPWNSIIPLGVIANFDMDTLNTVWMATPMGLVGYNNLGVVTDVEEKNAMGITVYPNPASRDVTFRNSKAQVCEVSIFDMNGQIISNFSIKENESLKTASLNAFDSGIYFYKITKGGQTQQSKLVIIK
ncbi:MAG: T9SS type A sorting domain-containing protein [Bacteroidota bacterium]